MNSQVEIRQRNIDKTITLLKAQFDKVDSFYNDFRQSFSDKDIKTTKLKKVLASSIRNLRKLIEQEKDFSIESVYTALMSLYPFYSLPDDEKNELPYKVKSKIDSAVDAIFNELADPSKKRFTDSKLIIENRKAFKSVIKLLRANPDLDQKKDFPNLDIGNGTFLQRLQIFLRTPFNESYSDDLKLALLHQSAAIAHDPKCPKDLKKCLIKLNGIFANMLDINRATSTLKQYHPDHLGIFPELTKLLDKNKKLFDEIELTNLKSHFNVTNPDKVLETYRYILQLLKKKKELPKDIKQEFEKAKLALLRQLSWNTSPIPILKNSENQKKKKQLGLFVGILIFATFSFFYDAIDGVDSIFDVISSFVHINKFIISGSCLLLAAVSIFSGYTFDLAYVANELGVKFLEVKSYIHTQQKKLDELIHLYEKLLKKLEEVQTLEDLQAIKKQLKDCDLIKNDIVKIQRKILEAKESPIVKVVKWITHALTFALLAADQFFMGTSAAIVILNWNGISASLLGLSLLSSGAITLIIALGVIGIGAAIFLYVNGYGVAIGKGIDRLFGNPAEAISKFSEDNRHILAEEKLLDKIKIKELELQKNQTNQENQQVIQKQIQEISALKQTNETMQQEKQKLVQEIATLKQADLKTDNPAVTVLFNHATPSPKTEIKQAADSEIVQNNLDPAVKPRDDEYVDCITNSASV